MVGASRIDNPNLGGGVRCHGGWRWFRFDQRGISRLISGNVSGGGGHAFRRLRFLRSERRIVKLIELLHFQGVTIVPVVTSTMTIATLVGGERVGNSRHGLGGALAFE